VKFGRVMFEICELTDRQTDKRANKQTNNGHADRSTLSTYLGRNNNNNNNNNNRLIIVIIKQGVALTGRNTTGPPCSRGAIIRLEAA